MTHQLRSQERHLVDTTLGARRVELNVLALGVAELAHRFAESREQMRNSGIENADSWHIHRRLSEQREGRLERRRPESDQQLATGDH